MKFKQVYTDHKKSILITFGVVSLISYSAVVTDKTIDSVSGITASIFLGAIFALLLYLVFCLIRLINASPEEKHDFEIKRLERKKQFEQHKLELQQQKAELRQIKEAKKHEREKRFEEIQLDSQRRQKERHKIKCPRCGSENFQLIGDHRKGFSVGKAVGGAVLTGGIGTLAGFAGGKTNKTDFVCLDCGKKFVTK